MEVVPWVYATALAGFVLFTIHCARRESFFKSARAIWQRLWGRQIVMDLYLGLFLFGWFIWQIESSPLLALSWIVASCIFGNIATLLFFVVHYAEFQSLF